MENVMNIIGQINQLQDRIDALVAEQMGGGISARRFREIEQTRHHFWVKIQILNAHIG